MLQSVSTKPRPSPSIQAKRVPKGHPKRRGSKYLALSNSRRIELTDIPDGVIDKILDWYILITKSNPSHIRLLNKRLARLALPFSLHTISLSTPTVLSNLILLHESPLFNPYLGIHVKCLELCYIPQTFRLLEVDNRMTKSFPNLVTLRFKFSMGVPLKSGLAIQPSLSQDVLLTSILFPPDAFLSRFLSQLRPRRFEWLSPEPQLLYLVGVSPMLRSLFISWETLSYIYLEGICLIRQPDLASWHIFPLSNRVHIKAPFSQAGSAFLDGLQNMRDSSRCALLLLEESIPQQKAMCHGEVPVMTYGNMMVSLKHWSSENRQNLKSRIARRSSPSTSTDKSFVLDDSCSRRAPSSSFSIVWVVGLFFLTGLCVIWIDTSEGSYSFSRSKFLWMICRDGSYLAEAMCVSETSLWFPDRSLMLHPT